MEIVMYFNAQCIIPFFSNVDLILNLRMYIKHYVDWCILHCCHILGMLDHTIKVLIAFHCYSIEAKYRLLRALKAYEAYLKEQLISYFLVTADSSTDMDSMDSSPWYFSGPTSSQTLILCPRWLQWCDPGTGPGYRPGKWTPNHKITSEFFSETKYLIFFVPLSIFLIREYD